MMQVQMEEKKKEYDQSSDQEEQSLLQKQQILSSTSTGLASNDDIKSYESFFRQFLGEGQPNQAPKSSTNSSSIHFGQIMSRLQDKLIEMLRENQFIVDEEPQSINTTSKLSNSSLPFQIKLIRHTPSFQVVELYCKLGRISKKIIIHNTFNKNHIHSSQTLPTHGNFSTAYDIDFLSQKQFIKCTNFNNRKNRKPQNTIKEYFIAIIMSALEIGPKIVKINGFDLCIYQQWNENKNKLIDKSNSVNSAFHNLECIEFMMEKCQKLTQLRQSERQLKFALLQMHALKICHVDIKPQNIMYSPTYGKAVLIDFGISLSLIQGIGKKTWTKFSGTVDFASDEMRSILNKSGYVDMYCNDVFGLQKSLQKICSQKSSYKSDLEKSCFLSSQLLQRFLSCSNFNRNTQADQYSQRVQSFMQFFELVSQSFQKNQQGQLLDLNKQLLVQLTKYLIYCYCVKWKDNYSGKSIQIKSFQQAIFRVSCFQPLQGEIDFFAKELNQFQDEDWTQPLYEKKQNRQSSMFYALQQSIDFEKLYFKICNISNTNHNIISTDQQGETQTQQQKYDQIQNLSNDPESYIQKLLKKTTLLRPPSKVNTNIIRDGSIRYTFYQRNLHILNIFKKNLKKAQQSNTQKSKLLQYFSQNTVQSYLPKQNQMNRNHYDILWFYAAILDMFMNQLNIQSYQNQNSNKENQNNYQVHLDSQFSFLLPYMFQILKNLILLGFNFYTFIKDYLRKCLNIVLYNKFLRKHLLLFVIKEFIEIGLLVNYTYFYIQKSDENKESTFKSDTFNEQLLKFDFDLDKSEFESDKEKNSLLSNIKLLQKLWIYFNHELVKFKLPYDELIKLFTQVESSIRRSFFQLNGEQKLIWCTVYEYLLQIVKDYAIIYYIGVLNVYQRNSTVIKNSENQYQKLWSESFHININSITKIPSQKESIENNASTILLPVPYPKKLMKESLVKFTPIKIDYFTLTDPINFIIKNNSVGEKISSICLNKLDAIILIPNVSIFLHLDIRLGSEFFTNNFQRFQQISSFVLNDKVENNHQIRIILNIVDVAIKMVKTLQDSKQSQNLIVLIVFLKKLMDNLIEIATFTSSKAQLQNIDLLFGQEIQKIYILYATTLSIDKNRSQQNFLKFIDTKQKILSAMNLFQTRNSLNYQVKIINLYNKHRMKGILPRYFSEFIRYERDDFIQIMTQVCQCFLKILQQNRTQEIKQQYGRGFQYFWMFFADKILIEIIPLMLLSNSSKEKYFQLIRRRKMTQHLSSNQQQLYITNSTFYLNAEFQKNNITPIRFLPLFQQYFIVHFGHQFITDKKHRRLKINFLGLAKQALNVFIKFCSVADDQLTKHTIEKFFQIQNRASISILYIYLILLEQKKQFFIKYPKEKERMQKKIVNRLKNATQTQDIDQYLEQFHLKQLEWNKTAKMQDKEEVSWIQSRREQTVNMSRLRRMIRHIPKDSLFRRSPIRERLLQFLSASICQSKKPKNSAYTLRILQQQHKEKRLKYVQVVLEELADRDILRHYFIQPIYKQKRIMKRIDEMKDKDKEISPQYFKSTEQYQLSQESTHPKKEISQSYSIIIDLAEKKMEKLAEQVVNKLIAQKDPVDESSQGQDKKYYQSIFNEYVTTNYQI